MRPLLGVTALGFAGYGLLLPVAPLWAVHGGAGEAGAGLVNAVLMAFTVLTQLGVHPALRRFGWLPVITAGMLALGIPSLLMPLSSALGAVLALSAVRGIGFGVVTVAGSSAVAELVPARQRGRAVGLYGLAVALPQLLLVPLGPILTTLIPLQWVFVLGTLPVAAVPCAMLLSRVLRASDAGKVTGPAARIGPDGIGGQSRVSAAPPPVRAELLVLAMPVLALLAITVPGGALLSFAPQLASGATLGALGLLSFTGTTTLSRWLLGRLADRHGPFLGIPVLLTVGAAGLVASAGGAASQDAAVLVAGMAVAGIAYGGVQNLTLVAAFALTPAAATSPVLCGILASTAGQGSARWWSARSPPGTVTAQAWGGPLCSYWSLLWR